MRNRLLVTTAVACALIAAPAQAQTAKITQSLFGTDGDPQLTANPVPNGNLGEVVGWGVCSDGVTCAPLAGASGRTLKPGETAAGTVFAVSVNYAGQVSSDRSAPWQGRVTATAPPALAGDVAVGSTVHPVAGTWTGGWGSEHDALRVEACRSAARAVCRVVAAQETPQAPAASVALTAEYAGCHLFAVDARMPRDLVFTVGADTRAAVPGQTVAFSAAAGQVAGAGCAAAGPTLSLRDRASRSDGRIVVGSVRCPARCVVEVTVSDGHRSVRRAFPPNRLVALALPRGAQLRPGRLNVRVTVDGSLAGSGHTRLSG
jgi:hypothetical protein